MMSFIEWHLSIQILSFIMLIIVVIDDYDHLTTIIVNHCC
nr:MAG TPA: hypothetical protein [Caudoviricetes sp.]